MRYPRKNRHKEGATVKGIDADTIAKVIRQGLKNPISEEIRNAVSEYFGGSEAEVEKFSRLVDMFEWIYRHRQPLLLKVPPHQNPTQN